MSQIYDGGPAFPLSTPNWHEQVNEVGYSQSDFTMGMTLRDYFAAKAMQGLLANPKLHEHILKNGGAFGGWIEGAAYGWADAMLKARNA